MLRLFDDRNRELHVPRPPARIVSLVPSDTHTLFALGAGERVVGRSDFCDQPAEVASVPSVGGTKSIDVDRVIELAPDLVLANQEESARAPVQKLMEAGLLVFVSFPRTVSAGISHVARLARLLSVDKEPAVVSLIRRGYEELRAAETAIAGAEPVPAFLPIWMEPMMTVSGDTFASDMLRLAGARNVFADRERRYPLAADIGTAEPLPPGQVGDRDTRYPRITVEEVVERNPAIVLLPDEPHDFTDADAAVFSALDIDAARRNAVRLCRGRDLFWYGAMSIDGLGRARRLVAELSGAEM